MTRLIGAKKGMSERIRRRLELRRSSAASPHRNKTRFAKATRNDWKGLVDDMEDLMDLPVLGKIKRSNGVMGEVSYTVEVTYPDEETSLVTFVGSVYGGPVVMITPGLPGGVFVKDVERFGVFGPDWVRRFFNNEA